MLNGTSGTLLEDKQWHGVAANQCPPLPTECVGTEKGS